MRAGEPEADLRPLDPDEAENASRWRLLVEVPVLVLFAALLAISVKAFVAQAFFIPSASMEPQLTAGDRVVVSRTAHELHDPRRGDVIVFGDPNASEQADDSFVVIRFGREALEAVGVARPEDDELIKCVVGLPGETVEGRSDGVHIDGNRLAEPCLDSSMAPSLFEPTMVPDGHVFVMGDNRDNSADSRSFGPVPTSSIVGRALARVWPPGRLAYL